MDQDQPTSPVSTSTSTPISEHGHEHLVPISNNPTALALHAFPGADDQKAGGSTCAAPQEGLITLLVHITRSTVKSTAQPAGSPVLVHQIIKSATARSGAYRLVARPSWMLPDGGGGISHSASLQGRHGWMQ